MEVTDEGLKARVAIVFDQAENRRTPSSGAGRHPWAPEVWSSRAGRETPLLLRGQPPYRGGARHQLCESLPESLAAVVSAGHSLVITHG